MITESDDQMMAESQQLQPTTSSLEAMQDAEKGATPDATNDKDAGPSDAIESNQSSLDGEEVKADPIRDAGGGKVRGPNGRYLPKDDVLPIPKKAKKPKGKGGKSGSKPVDRSKSHCISSTVRPLSVLGMM